MSDTLDVHDLDALRRLDVAAARFADALEGRIETTERAAGHVLDDLGNLRRVREREFRDAEHERDSISDDDDDASSRSDAENDVERKRDSLEEANDCLGRLCSAVQRARTEFAAARKMLRESFPEARAYLNSCILDLNNYGAFRTGGGGVGGGSSVPIREGAPSSPLSGAMLELAFRRLPAGFKWVRIEDVDFSEVDSRVRGAQDFQKATMDTISGGFHQLRETILPALQVAPSLGWEYFRQQDEAAGREIPSGAEAAFHAFFGKDCIALDPKLAGGCLGVTSGAHRLFVARELGWSAIPALILDGSEKR